VEIFLIQCRDHIVCIKEPKHKIYLFTSFEIYHYIKVQNINDNRHVIYIFVSLEIDHYI
jgi:hypothetical protein